MTLTIEQLDDAAPAASGPASFRAGRLRRVAMRLRRPLVRLHRWAGMALLVWLVVVATTGAWLVGHHTFEAWLHPDRYATTSGDVGAQAAVDTVRSEVGDSASVDYVVTPRNNRGVYGVWVSIPEDASVDAAAVEGAEPEYSYVEYFVDPGTGTVTDRVDSEEGLTWWLYRGHMYLWQDNGLLGAFDVHSGWCRQDAAGNGPGGLQGLACDVIPSGEDLVAWLAVGWIVVLVSGFYLWYWPGVRRWATALTIKRDRGAFAFNLSLHKVIGLVVWVPLVVIAFTGAAFAFPAMKDWYARATPAQSHFELWTVPEDLVSSDANGREPLDLDDARRIFAERYPDRALEGVTPPADETGTFLAWDTRGFSPWTRDGGAGNVYTALDQYSGDTLYDGTPGAGNVFDQAWDDYSFPLHTGDVLGAPTRVAWTVFALSPVALGVSGLTMNQIRRRKRARRGRGARVKAPAGADNELVLR